MAPNVTRPSLLVFWRANRYLDEAYDWSSFDIREWSDEGYTWRQDPWNGLLDFVQRPRETIEAGEGDCDDYALVAASWAAATGRDDVGLGLLGTGPLPSHMVAFDAERTYSSGTIHDCNPGAYFDGSSYRWLYTRML